MLLLSLFLRVWLAFYSPFSADESSYLYDAKLLAAGQLPGGDVLAKSPVSAAIFTASSVVSRYSLWAARAVSLVAGVATALPLFWLLVMLASRRMAWWSVLLWLLVAPIPLQVLGQTESVAMFFIVLALALWVRVLSLPDLSQFRRLAILTGIVAGMAFLSRKTTVAAVLPAMFWWQISVSSVVNKRRALLLSGLAAALVVGGWAAILFQMYGAEGLREGLGVGYGGVVHEHFQDSANVAWGNDFTWTWEVLVTVAPGFLLLSGIGLIGGLFHLKSGHAPTSFFLIWTLVLAGLYSVWPAFLPEYVVDFSVPLVALGALVIVRIKARWQRAAVAIIFIGLSVFGVWQAKLKPWNGMYSRLAINEAATQLIQHVPIDEPVLTAAVVIPYVSGHDSYLGITHPFWYRYDFVSDATKEAFLPPRRMVEEAIVSGAVQWLLFDDFTDYAYFREPLHLISRLESDWELVAEISNDTGYRNNPLKLYRRVHSK